MANLSAHFPGSSLQKMKTFACTTIQGTPGFADTFIHSLHMVTITLPIVFC